MEEKDETHAPFSGSNKDGVECNDVKECIVDLDINDFTRNSSYILF